MAGKYIEIINPGYSTLFTRDLKFVPNTSRGEASTDNMFDPDSDNPLIEGEWLCMDPSGNTSNKVAREGSVTADDLDNIGKEACFLHFHEKGRYDAQITKKAHCISGPCGFEFKSKLGSFGASASVAVGKRVFVCDIKVGSVYKRGLSIVSVLHAGVSANNYNSVADYAGGSDTCEYYWSPGYIERWISSGEAVIKYDPQLILLTVS